MAPIKSILASLALTTFVTLQVTSATPLLGSSGIGLSSAFDPSCIDGSSSDSFGGSDPSGCETNVPIPPTTLAPETNFSPISNVLPIVNVFPANVNDYSCPSDCSDGFNSPDIYGGRGCDFSGDYSSLGGIGCDGYSDYGYGGGYYGDQGLGSSFGSGYGGYGGYGCDGIDSSCGGDLGDYGSDGDCSGNYDNYGC
ncbi:hypothetical protein BGZ49_003265 [Haplosporangium sp. Z 27]|nr:hypothetical protein BGZ49_003265 [Haplosporangium sp. Z 27]